MAKTYAQWEEEELEKAKGESESYATERRGQAATEKSQTDALYNRYISQAETNYTAAAEETAAEYRKIFDANAINELVLKQQIEEAYANLNLTNSGLNATQQTAIALSRSRADHQTATDKQKAVDAIMRELDTVRTQYQNNAVSAKQSIDSAAESDIRSYQQTASANARARAATLYTADQETEAAAAQLQWEQQAKQKGNETTGDSVAEANTKAKAMSAAGTPSYTAIRAQAMAYARNISSEKAREYIEQQYAMGYITEAQRDKLLAVHTQSAKDAVQNSILTPGQARYNGELNIYRTYENYVNAMLQEAIAEEKITAEEAAEIAIGIETQHGVNLNPNK